MIVLMFLRDPSNPFWPKYDNKFQKYMALRSFPTVESQLRPDKMAFWNTFLPKTGQVKLIVPKTNPRYPPGNHGNHSQSYSSNCHHGSLVSHIIVTVTMVIWPTTKICNHSDLFSRVVISVLCTNNCNHSNLDL